MGPSSCLYLVEEKNMDLKVRVGFIQQSIGSPNHTNQTRKKKLIKGIQIGKKDVKLSQFIDVMIYRHDMT